jgi:hypothetical protein
MSTEAMWIEPRPAPAGLRCRYCARILAAATEPDRMTPHCGAAGCRVCTECATGATSVSPVRVPDARL